MIDLKSISIDQKIFRLAPYSLNTSSEYIISIIVTSTSGFKGIANVKVIVNQGDIFAMISGGDYQLVSTSKSISLDASHSYSFDYPNQQLNYLWSSNSLNGLNCLELMNISSSIMTIHFNNCSLRSTYNISVLVTSNSMRFGIATIILEAIGLKLKPKLCAAGVQLRDQIDTWFPDRRTGL
jgi:hypothetical protein